MTEERTRVLYGGCLPATPFRDLVAAAATAGFPYGALRKWARQLYEIEPAT